VCFLCEKKNFRKDRKLHKIESSDRLNNLMESAVGQNDQRLIQIMDENASSSVEELWQNIHFILTLGTLLC
jgi:hypothetical protein